ncbi:hypothetical protein LCGC14_0328050 [marine sediment metagenome]|uniref:Bacterial type II secretion system protein E domain-containing protein n=1 Tax=marine sediment metagenome TaxID=412755 RepID=A0A0F9W4K2_9ZZZZ
MAANLNDTEVDLLINKWGFSETANELIYEHAANVLGLKSKRVGEIIVGLGISSSTLVDNLLMSKPKDVRSLEYLRGHIKGLSTRIDEILCVQIGLPYISRTMQSIVVHPFAKGVKNNLSHEMNLLDVIPVLCGETVVMMFGDFEKMMHFRTMGKSERLQNVLYTKFAEEIGKRPDRVEFHTAVAESTVFSSYHQQISDGDGSRVAQEQALQIISQSEGGKDPVIAQIVRILNEAISQEINDVSIVPDYENGKGIIQFRRYQRLENTQISLTTEERESVVRLLIARSRASKTAGTLRQPADGNLSFEGKFGQAFLRLSFIPLEESRFPAISVSIRIMPKTTKSISLASLNISPLVQKELNYAARRKYGLFVVCGPTGSGKSTTIGGMICSHNDEYGSTLKRVSVEQPVERILPGVHHIDVSQHHYVETGVDKFGMSLRSILRHDPDLIFVGEVRDKESCMVSIDAANTGHLVLTTTHANDPVLGYRRLASFLDKERRFDLVNVLDGILAQRLIPTLCPVCSTEKEFTDEDRSKFLPYAASRGLDINSVKMPKTHRVINKDGCNSCSMGYNAMVPVHGLMTMNPKVRELLLSNDESDWMKAQGASDSDITLFKSAFVFFLDGTIELDSVLL